MPLLTPSVDAECRCIAVTSPIAFMFLIRPPICALAVFKLTEEDPMVNSAELSRIFQLAFQFKVTNALGTSKLARISPDVGCLEENQSMRTKLVTGEHKRKKQQQKGLV
jgi:hypothetical protein